MKTLGLLAIVAALAVGFAWAQDDTSTDTSTAATESASVDFMSYDADGDGILTADELGQGLLTAYDSNADGSVDQTEFDAMAGSMGGGMSSDTATTDTSTSTDSASTDSASTDTTTASSSGMLGDFTSFDVSADGTLDATELGQGFLTAYDVNADSSLDETELAGISGSTPTQ
jgi:Ca2+-binding EF-hand superfamily protein